MKNGSCLNRGEFDNNLIEIKDLNYANKHKKVSTSDSFNHLNKFK